MITPQDPITASLTGNLGSAIAVAAIVPSDTIDLPSPSRAIYVGVAGDVKLRIGGTDVVFVAVPAGTFLPVIATRVWATGTTATSLVFMQ